MLGLRQFYRTGFGPSSSHTIAPGAAMSEFLNNLELLLQKEKNMKTRSDIINEVGYFNATFSGISFYDTGVGHKSPHALELSLNEFFQNEGFEWVIKSGLNKDEKDFDIKCFTSSSSDPINCMGISMVIEPPEALSFETEEDKENLNDLVKNLSNGLMIETFDNSGNPLLMMAGFSVGGGVFYWVSKSVEGEEIEYLRDDVSFYPEPCYPDDLTALADIKNWCIVNNCSLSDFVEHHEDEESIDWLYEVLWKEMDMCIRKGYDSVNIRNAYFDVRQKVRRRAYTMKKELMKLRKSPNIVDTDTEWNDSEWKQAVNFPDLSRVFPSAAAVMETNIMGASPNNQKVVTAPTCGSCGVLPAVLDTCLHIGLCEKEEQIKKALEVAFLIGNLAKTNGSLSGAEAGCAAEIGVATAMGAAAMAVLLVEDEKLEFEDEMGIICGAAAIGLRLATSLTCDISVHGEVTIPCMERNSIYASQAMKAAEIMYMNDVLPKRIKLPLDNLESLLDGSAFDEAVVIMYLCGKGLPSAYKESSSGPTGKVLDPDYGKRSIYPMKTMKSILENFFHGPGPSSSLGCSLYRGLIEVMEKNHLNKNEDGIFQFSISIPKSYNKSFVVKAKNQALKDLGIPSSRVEDHVIFEYLDDKEYDRAIVSVDFYADGESRTKPSKNETFECLIGGHYHHIDSKPDEWYSEDVYFKHCTFSEISDWCVQNSRDVSSYVISSETTNSEIQTVDSFLDILSNDVWKKMVSSIRNGLKKMGFSQDDNILVDEMKRFGERGRLTFYAMAVVKENCSGGMVVSSPFGNLGCGILPSVISIAVEHVVGMNILEVDSISNEETYSDADYVRGTFSEEQRKINGVIEANHLIVRGLCVAGMIGNFLNAADITPVGLSDLTLLSSLSAGAASHIFRCDAIRAIAMASEIVVEHSLGLIAACSGKKRPVDPEYDIFLNLAVENASFAQKSLDAAQYSHLTNQYSEVELEQILWVLESTNLDMIDTMKNVKRSDLEGYTTVDYFNELWEPGSMDIFLEFDWK